MKKIHKLFITMLVLAAILNASPMKPQEHKALEIINDFSPASQVVANMRIEKRSGIPRAIYSPQYQVSPSDPEAMARQYLLAQSDLLHHTSQNSELTYTGMIETPAGYRVQFVQEVAGFPVYRSSIKISLNRSNEVVFVTNGYQPIPKIDMDLKISEAEALEIAKTYLGIDAPNTYENIETIIYKQSFISAVVAQKVTIVPSQKLYGDWEVLVAAGSGEIIRVEDKACYFDAARETGIGWVFDPDPITAARTFYGEPQFSDNGDQNSDSLARYIVEADLEGLTSIDHQYFLSGPFAAINDAEAPFTGLYGQSSLDFRYTRDQPEFEAVNIYFHLNHSMAYLNDSLGFDVMPYQYEGGVQFDPHGLDGGQNAHFMPSTGAVAFGSPANFVDAGEDHSIVLHELGHGIHDWITFGGISQVDGLSEGLGDYWAQSYTRSLGLLSPEDPQYDYFGQWGLQPYGNPSLRVTDFPNHYPDELGGEVHYDGQLWASSLMSIYDLIGRQATDTDCWEGISMTDINSNQVDAAYAFIQADQDVYNSAHLAHIIPVFQNRGYLNGPVSARFTSDINAGPGPLEVTFQDLSFGYPDSINSWRWDFNNDGIIDSELPNPTHTFTDAGTYSITQIVSNGTAIDTLIENGYISVNSGVLVYEGIENGQDYSGQFISDELESLNLAVNYSNRFPSSFSGFDAVFISLGNLGGFQSPATILAEEHLNTILSYVSSGGSIYVEGGSMMALVDYFSYPNIDSLWSAFGVEYAELYEDDHPMLGLSGENNSIVADLSFSNSTQANNSFLDHLEVSAPGVVAFTEPTLGNVAIQNAGNMGQHTFYLTYSLSDFVDGSDLSTRSNVIQNILSFFQIPILVPEVSASTYTGHAPLEVQFSDASISFPEAISWHWDFDSDGVMDSEEQNPLWTYTEPGEYLVKLVVGNESREDSTTQSTPIHVFDGESSINFGGSGDVVLVPGSDVLNVTDAFTLETWIYPVAWGNQNTGDARIIDKTFIRLFLNKNLSTEFSDSSLGLILKHQDGTLSKIGTTPNSITLNEWQHIAVSYAGDSSEIHLYINGIDRTLINVAPSGPLMNHAIWTMHVGNNNTRSAVFEGRLDELRFWNTARDLDEIAPRMSDYLNGDETGLIGYWRMNEGNGEVLNDLTQNHHSATIENSNWDWGTSFVVPVGVANHEVIPVDRLLVSSYPNPFNPITTIRYGLPSETSVDITIFNIQGQMVRSYSLDGQPTGWYELEWNGMDGSGSRASSGIYFCSIQTELEYETIKLVMLK
ncbi:MAG: PKD domain-containing protein [Candidatus Marinimicrobia bacterium]|nr:PKD domain-containing protein [Candidatus Neomarinimicrobiota bacterium]